MALNRTCIELAEAIRESFGEFVCQQHFYVSEDMKQGIDVVGVTVHADLLAPIIKLDPRGGSVRHLDMVEAVQQLSEMPVVRAAFEAMDPCSQTTVERFGCVARLFDKSHARARQKERILNSSA